MPIENKDVISGTKRRRWYINLPWLLVLGSVFIFLTSLVLYSLTSLFLYSQTILLNPQSFKKIVPALVGLGMLMDLTAMTWCLTALPWFFSGDLHLKWNKPPRLMVRTLFTHTALPCALIGGFFASLAWGQLITNNHSQSINWWTYFYLLSPCLIIFLLIVPVTLKVRRVAIQRFANNLTTRQVCFKCGYSLHGNPDANCPECGYDSKQFEQSIQKQNSLYYFIKPPQ